MRVIGVACTLALLFAMPAGAQTDDPQPRLKHLSWSIEELVNAAELIVAAELQMVDKWTSFGHRTLGLTIDSVVSGTPPASSPIYVIAPPPADDRKLSPAILFAGARYLLFLVHDAASAQAASEFGTDPANVFSITGRWRGAVALEGGWPDVSNRFLDARGLLPAELRPGAAPSADSGASTIEAVRDMAELRRPGVGLQRSEGPEQQAARSRLLTSDHPWAAKFLEEAGENPQATPR